MSIPELPENLPESPIRAYGPWVLVMVEPPPKTYGMIILVDTGRDNPDSPGIGWVLSAAEQYDWISPEQEDENKKEKKLPSMGNKDVRYDMDVKRGDKILFRRFLRSQGLMQYGLNLNNMMRVAMTQFSGYEWFFIHIHDIIGVIEE